MSKSEVQARFLIDVPLNKVSENTWLLRLETAQIQAMVEFRDGIVTGATKFWMQSQSEETEAVLGALDSLSREGPVVCVVQHKTNTIASYDVRTAPGSHLDAAAIECGARVFVMSKLEFTATDSRPSSRTVGVDEVIGSAWKLEYGFEDIPN